MAPKKDRRSGGNKDGQQQSRQGSSQTGQPRPRQQSHQFEGNLENSASFPAMGQQFPRGDSTTWRQAQPPPLQQLSPPSFFQQSAQQQSGSQKKTPQKESSEKLPLSPSSKELGELELSDKWRNLHIPNRKNPSKAGTKGKSISVYTNMLPIKLGKNFPNRVIHYDIGIEPDKPKYLYRKIFEQVQKQYFPQWYPAFDGKKNAYSTNRLPKCKDDGEVFEVSVPNMNLEPLSFKVTIKFAAELDMSWLKNVRPGLQESDKELVSLQALNVILSMAAVMKTTPVGRSYFTQPKGRVISLGGGMDLWYGLFQSAVIGWKPFLNVDVAHKGFPTPQNVIDFIKDSIAEANQRSRAPVQRPNNLTYDDVWITYRKKIEDHLKSLLVETNVNGQRRSRQIIHGLIQKNAKDNFFEMQNGQKISVYQYFKEAKNYTIKYPDLPCLWIGNRMKNIHVPLEICTIMPGQALRRKLDENQTANMVKLAATSTRDRERKIKEQFQNIDHNNHQCLKHFDISINGAFEKVPARILDPPKLKYSNGIQTVSKGVWQNGRFLYPSASIEQNSSWTILNTDARTTDKQLQDFRNAVLAGARNVGLRVGEPYLPFVTSPIQVDRRTNQVRARDLGDLQDTLNDYKRKGIKFIFVIFNDYVKSSYSVIKQIAELKVGILTQCIKTKTLTKTERDRYTVANILQKVNAKLNGKNHVIDVSSFDNGRPKCLGEPCMIVGADVTHPSPDSTNFPSIAAVTASHDPNAFMYNIELRFQDPKMEIIQDLKNIIKIQLKSFFTHTRQKPSKIIFLRDGVSDGQFLQVMSKELQAIRDACTELQKDYKPSITFLVVQKRHHIRFFPTENGPSDDRNFNVKAGTIVDTEITHPSHIDFYLVSHASIQGTARPTKYTCLHDDSEMSEDEIEQLTYFLCHMFSRCTRSVSYPTPTYYAHLAAFRARAYIQDIDVNLQDLAREQEKKLTIKADFLKEQPMFFV